MSTSDDIRFLLDLVIEASLPLIESKEQPIHESLSPSAGIAARTLPPQTLNKLLDLQIHHDGGGRDGFKANVDKLFRHSTNTWSQGYIQKLYGSTDAAGVASELILAFLNQNVHVYEAAPVLTLVEKYVTKQLAQLFGLDEPESGGISVQGGSASNTTSIVVARNTLYPKTKTEGNNADGLRLVLLTSAHGHYSIEKAAQMLGFGSSAVHPVSVLADGSMDVAALGEMIPRLKSEGLRPFYVNATAGTTVLGSYDDVSAISEICKTHRLWLHIDASWGGPAIFSDKHRSRLRGSHLADSIAINPHKMMAVPLTCSFLLGRDLRQFQQASTTQAEYLFHSSAPPSSADMYDLADLTLQCGRRGDSLKLYMSWVYHGTQGYREQIDGAFANAAYLSQLARDHKDIVLVSSCPPPCLQVCFFHAKGGHLKADNSRITQEIVKRLKPHGFIVDFAAIDDRGQFLRPVIHKHLSRTTVETLLELVVKIGGEVWDG